MQLLAKNETDKIDDLIERLKYLRSAYFNRPSSELTGYLSQAANSLTNMKHYATDIKLVKGAQTIWKTIYARATSLKDRFPKRVLLGPDWFKLIFADGHHSRYKYGANEARIYRHVQSTTNVNGKWEKFSDTTALDTEFTAIERDDYTKLEETARGYKQLGFKRLALNYYRYNGRRFYMTIKEGKMAIVASNPDAKRVDTILDVTFHGVITGDQLVEILDTIDLVLGAFLRLHCTASKMIIESYGDKYVNYKFMHITDTPWGSVDSSQVRGIRSAARLLYQIYKPGDPLPADITL